MKSYNGFTGEQRLEGDKIIKQAITQGRLKPAEACGCTWCGQNQGIRHYHTEDYTPSRIVELCIVLCWRCHMVWHSRRFAPEAVEKYMSEIKAGKQYPPVYRHDFRILAQEHGITR